MRLINNNTVYEELAFSDLMETNSTERLVFEKIIRFFEVNKIPSKHLIQITIDSALSMIGKYRGLIRNFKDLNPEIITIHRKHLVAKVLSYCLNNSLNLVIKADNRIKGMLYNVVCLKSCAMKMMRFLTG